MSSSIGCSNLTRRLFAICGQFFVDEQANFPAVDEHRNRTLRFRYPNLHHGQSFDLVSSEGDIRTERSLDLLHCFVSMWVLCLVLCILFNIGFFRTGQSPYSTRLPSPTGVVKWTAQQPHLR